MISLYAIWYFTALKAKEKEKSHACHLLLSQFVKKGLLQLGLFINGNNLQGHQIMGVWCKQIFFFTFKSVIQNYLGKEQGINQVASLSVLIVLPDDSF